MRSPKPDQTSKCKEFDHSGNNTKEQDCKAKLYPSNLKNKSCKPPDKFLRLYLTTCDATNQPHDPRTSLAPESFDNL